jgi:hypothetical protein
MTPAPGAGTERARREGSMDIAQIVLLVGAANLVVLVAGATLAMVRSVGRRRQSGRRSGDGPTHHSSTDSGAAVS